MKAKLIPILALLAATVLVIGQAVSFQLTIDLTENQARGLNLAVQKYNAAQRELDTNHVDQTPRQYVVSLLQNMLDDFNRQYDEENFTQVDVKQRWLNATPAQRQAAIDALSQ